MNLSIRPEPTPQRVYLKKNICKKMNSLMRRFYFAHESDQHGNGHFCQLCAILSSS